MDDYRGFERGEFRPDNGVAVALNGGLGSVRRSPGGSDWEAVEHFLDQRHAPATRAVYRSSWRKFEAWCSDTRRPSLPAAAETVAMFLASEGTAGRSPSTIARHKAAIRHAHLDAGLADPTGDGVVPELLKGIRRSVGLSKTTKAPMTEDLLDRVLAPIDDTVAGLRDRAILTLGYAAALRRSELARLTVDDVAFDEGDLTVRIRRSKTDQEARGQEVTLTGDSAERAASAITRWVEAANIADGFLFRRINKGGRVRADGLTPHGIGAIVKRRVAAADLDAEIFGAHSLRSGALTDRAKAGDSVWQLRARSRHKSVASLQEYVRIE